jgi:hypothetical protein
VVGLLTPSVAPALPSGNHQEVPPPAIVPPELTTGAFHLDQARRLGLTMDHLRGASWRRLGGGYYAWREIADDPLVALAAMRRRMPPQAVFSGRTAAWLHGVDEFFRPIEVTIPQDSAISRRSGAVVRRASIPPTEICMRRGLRSTSVARTIADICRRRSLVDAVVATDVVLHKGLTSRAQLRAWAERHARFPGVARLRRVIELAEPATESPMETRLRLVLVRAGLPRPQSQVSLRDAEGRFLGRPDLYYPDHRLAIEYDGAGHREQLAADNRRQNRLVDAGYRLLRFTASDVLSEPDTVASLVSRALG